MKLPCQLVQDLLPLYEDCVCSDASRNYVEAHLSECPTCRSLLARQPELFQEEPSPDISEDMVVARSFRKVRRRWWISLVAALLILPLVLLSVNQYRGEGICFTNLDDIYSARRFCSALAEGDFNRAAELLDAKALYEDVQEALGRSEEDYRLRLDLVTIGSRDYAVSPSLEMPADFTDLTNFWARLVFNGVWGCMIPEDIWAQVITLDPGAVEIIDGTTYVNGFSFTRSDTLWGTFYVRDDAPIPTSACDLANTMSLMPAEIWYAAQEALDEQTREHYAFNQSYYAQAREMDYEEFASYVRGAYAEGLQRLADSGYTFTLGGVEDCYYRGEWVVIHSLTLTGNDFSLELSPHISVSDNGLFIGCLSQSAETTDIDPAEYLFFRYPAPENQG